MATVTGLEAANYAASLKGKADEFLFAPNTQRQEYMVWRASTYLARPTAIHPYFMAGGVKLGDTDRISINRIGDVIPEIDNFYGYPALIGRGTRVYTQAVDAETVDLEDDAIKGNALRAGIRAGCADAGKDIPADKVAHISEKLIDEIVAAPDASMVETTAKAQAFVMGGTVPGLNNAAMKAMLDKALSWYSSPQLAIAGGYDVNTGLKYSAEGAFKTVPVPNAIIPVRYVNYVALRTAEYKSAKLLELEQIGFDYLYQYLYQVLLRAPSNKLIEHYGGFLNTAAGDAAAVAWTQRPQRVYQKNPFYFSEDRTMAYPYSNVFFHPLTLETKAAAFDSLWKMSSVEADGTPVHPDSKVEEIWNISGYKGKITNDLDLDALKKDGKACIEDGSGVKTGHLILFASYCEEDRMVLSKHNFIQLSTIAKTHKHREQRNIAGDELVESKQKCTINFMIKAMWSFMQTDEAVRNKNWFDFAGYTDANGVRRNGLVDLQIVFQNQAMLGCTDAEYMNRAAHATHANDVTELERCNNHIAGIYKAHKVTGPLYTGALNGSMAGELEFVKKYAPECFFDSKGKPQNITEYVVSAATNIAVFEDGKSGQRYLS
jgi:hypothetical protein